MPYPAVLALDGVVRPYAWGSHTAIQQLLGTEPDGRPAAELWFGAHPDDPAVVAAHGTTLDKIIAADPAGTLGAQTLARFGPRLPFLLKVLAADQALSIQVHPNLAQARAGFADEDARGVPRDAPERNYRDPNHKPELLCALTPFEALCGFRPVEDTLRLLDEFGLPELEPVRELLGGETGGPPSSEGVAAGSGGPPSSGGVAAGSGGPPSSGGVAAGGGIRAAFTYLLTLAEPVPLVTAVAARADAIDAASPWAGAAGAVLLAAGDFPGDIGAVLSLLLNYVRLEPGEAIYLGAGNVHAYLRGTGVEIMANSDNVLRCGLTPKHIDVPELLKITDFRELAEPRCPDSGLGGFGVDFAVPVPDFHLHSADLDAYRKPGRAIGSCATGDAGQPYIVLCVSGAVTVDVDGMAVELTPGHAAFVPAREPAFTLRGTGQSFLATVGAPAAVGSERVLE